MPDLGSLRERLRFDSAFWRKLAWFGAARGPRAWLRASPPAFGLAFALALPGPRRIVRDNLRRVLGRRGALPETLDVARTFMTFASAFADALALSGDRGYEAHVEVIGAEGLDRALGEGRGVVLVTAHTAGWDASLASLRRTRSVPVMVAMQAERDAGARALHDSLRSRLGIRVVHVGEDPLAALPVLSHLRRGGVVALQIDRCPAGVRHRSSRLFGSPWRIPEGPLALASMTGAPLVAVFACRTGFLSYLVCASEPVRLPRRPTGAQLDAAAARLAGELERFVARHPTQWLHFVADP
jgi:KDO2-lipid IV(A) lauroyltransferase